jgi:membrane protein implicated in regulation of membrane protease activity
MPESSVWWIATGVVVAAELLSGTFYLLMLAVGLAAAAIAAHLGLSTTAQLLVAAGFGGGAVYAWHVKKVRGHLELPAQANPNVNLDIGETVQVNAWNPDGTADVQYRGAHWTAVHRAGVTPTSGLHRVAELMGNRLLLDKTH